MSKLSWTSTVVGSFPYENSPENMEKAFWDQINNGVEYPCYPQLIGMIEQFLDPLVELNCGIVKKGKQYFLEGELTVPEKPIALKYGQFVLDFFEKYPEAKNKVKGWKACLTGPFTLAGDILIDPELVGGKNPIIYQEPRAIMSPELLEKLASIMKMIGKAYSDMGATIISMDEPTLGLIVGKRRALFHKEDFIIKTLNEAISGINSNSSIHICGRISPKLRDILLNSNVNIMDHEFIKSDNEGLVTQEQLEKHNKTLAYGTVASSLDYVKDGTIEDYVEKIDEMETRVKKIIEEFGKENVILKPDCGFGGLLASMGQEKGSEIVRRKLKLISDMLTKF